MNHTSIRPYFLGLFITLLIVVTFYLLRPFVITLALAAIFSVILRPFHNWLSLKMPRSKGITAFLTMLIGVIVIALPLTFLGFKLFTQAESVYVSLSTPASVAHLEQSLGKVGSYLNTVSPGIGNNLSSASFNINSYSRSAFAWSLAHAGTAFTHTVSILVNIFIFFMTLYYLLKEGSNTKRALLHLSPLTEGETHTILMRLSRTIESVVRGHLTIATLQGVLTGIGFLIFGIPNSLLWGVSAGFSALIPGIGTSLILVPGILYLFVTGHTWHAVGLLIWTITVVGLIDNFLSPRLVGSRASIHPLLILLSVLGGIAFYGPAGIFLGPLTISLLIGLLSIYAPTETTEGEVVEVKTVRTVSKLKKSSDGAGE